MSILFENVLGLFEAPAGGFTVRNTNIYIVGNEIAGIDRAPADFSPERRIDGAGKLLIPGLINSHTHVPMTILRNAADDLKFHEWLFGRILPLEEKLFPEDCYWGTQLGLMEMLRTGTTCFLDMYFHIDHIAQAISDAGARAVLSRGLMGGAEDPSGGERRLREAEDEVFRWRGHENLSFMLAPHAPYTCDPGYQREVAQTAKQLGLGIHTHIAESVREVEEIVTTYGKRPAALLEESGLLTNKTVAAHCVHLDGADIERLARCGVHVAHNPVSNLKLANGIAPVPKLLAAGVNVALGTDGAASNNTLNLFRDLNFATLLHKGVSGNPEVVPAAQGLEMVWANGALALGLGNVGKLAEGFLADLVLIDLSHPNLQPSNDPITALAYAASGHEVALTMVGGKILYENGTYPTIDAARVYEEVEKICGRIGLRGVPASATS